MKCVSISCFLFLYIGAFAQLVGELTGNVSSTNSLEKASVTLLKTSFTSASDTNGNFVIKNIPVGKYQLRISYIGYENFQEAIEITAGCATAVNATLIPFNSHLKEIVVTGTLKDVKKSESVTPVEVYTEKFFQRNISSTIYDALKNINGVFADVDNGVSNTTDIQLNGLEGNYTMILIDGVPAINGLAGTYALNTIPMSMIDRIEILKGASSTIYGSDAIAGVINIKTKSPTNAPRFACNVALNSMLIANADFTLAFKIKKANSLVSVSGESNSYRWDLNGDNFIDMPLTNRLNFFNKWSFDRKENLVADIYARYLFEDRIGGEMHSAKELRASNVYYSEAIRTHQWQVGTHYQLPLREKVMLQIDFSEHRQHANYGTKIFDGLQRNGFSQLSWSKKTDAINELLLGVSYRINYYNDNTELSVDSISGHGKLLHIAGAFMEDELLLPKNNQLVIGARFDYNNQSGPIFTPRINYKWHSNDELNTIRIGVGTGYRTPNLLNEGFAALNGSRQIIVHEKLQAEVALNANASYTRIQKLTGGILNAEMNGFYTYFFNFINPDFSEPGYIIYKNNKLGAMAAGFSVNADLTFNYPLKVGVGFTYSHVFEKEKNDNGEIEKEIPTHSPPFVANFFLSYTFAAPQLSIDWTGNVVSPMLLSTVPDDFRPSHSPWFTIQNIQLTKKFSSGIELYAGVKNFFNFIQKEPFLRPFDPYNKNTSVNNPFNYRFDTTYGFTSTEGIKGFVGLRYTLH